MFKLNVPLQTLFPSVSYMPCFECGKETLYLVVVQAIEDGYVIHLACSGCQRTSEIHMRNEDMRQVQNPHVAVGETESLDLSKMSLACDKCGHLMEKHESVYTCGSCGNTRLESDFL